MRVSCRYEFQKNQCVTFIEQSCFKIFSLGRQCSNQNVSKGNTNQTKWKTKQTSISSSTLFSLLNNRFTLLKIYQWKKFNTMSIWAWFVDSVYFIACLDSCNTTRHPGPRSFSEESSLLDNTFRWKIEGSVCSQILLTFSQGPLLFAYQLCPGQWGCLCTWHSPWLFHWQRGVFQPAEVREKHEGAERII